MDRVFKSKIGWWYHLIVVLIVAGSIKVILDTNIVNMAVMLLVDALVLHILFNTWYKITEEGMLIAHCSIFPEKRIPIAEITAIQRSILPASSYALSLNRLMLYKGEKQWLLISPVNEADFIRLLRKINPGIELMQ